MAQVVYTRAAADSDVRGDLFGGLRFFIAQRCPSRTTYVDKVVSNGGEVVKLETQADLLIADDISKKTYLNPAGAISYKFIDDSIRTGTLADAEDDKYRAGPVAGSARPVGSSRPVKIGRTPFTLDDKIQLYEFVQSYAEKGGSVRGNEIYKHFEALNSRHTYQAWRDHYIKNLEGRPHPGNGKVTVRQTAPPTPPVDTRPDQLQEADDGDRYEVPPPTKKARPMTTAQARRQRQEPVNMPSPAPALRAPGFLASDIHDLLANGDDILDTTVRHEAAAWQAWTNACAESATESAKAFTPNEWKLFWQRIVRPIYDGYTDEDGNIDNRRNKIYNTSWLAWDKLNPTATADEWLEYYDLVVKPLMESGEELRNETPAKKQGSQIFGEHVNSPAGREVHVEIAGLAKKRTSEEMDNGEAFEAATPSKRQRLPPPIAPVIHAEEHDGEIDADASLRAFVNISDDDEAPQSRMNDGRQATPTPQQVNGNTPASSPPPTTATKKRNAPVQDTQAILAESQAIDFDITEPEGGFDNEELYPSLGNHDVLTSSRVDPLGHELAARATAAVQAETDEDADTTFDMPDLPEPTSAYVTAPSHLTSTSARAAPGPQLLPGYPPLGDRIELLGIQALNDAGRPLDLMFEAVLRTSADPKLFRMVLRHLESRRGVPPNTRGVWTANDDEAVQGSDARELQRLERKHGTTGLHSIEGRLEFLREWTEHMQG